ncbi:hypothetical protein SAY87_029619 [Trapa incisa]|uniref:Uncharacterized protein n=1 Tax=Trapa incisa TaxID=236973 RepID=A0AAN7QDB8_9MYRT|nr:hypothetical protein SAY87_029619 [Trapa incisa]
MAALDHETAAPEAHDHDGLLLQDLDDAELETLSFCDLPLYSDQHDLHFEEDGSQQFSSTSPNIDHEEDPFEFSSEDLSASSSVMCRAESVIFCGRLITYRQDDPPSEGAERSSHKLRKKKNKNKKWRGFFKWRLSPFRRNHGSRLSNCHEGKIASENQYGSGGLGCLPPEKYRYVTEKYPKEEHGFSTGRFSVLMGWAKCRWYVLMFRPVQFPVEMRLKDMKSSQSRRSLSSRRLRSMEVEDRARSGSGGPKSGAKGNWNSGLWRLLGALSCSRSQQCGGSAIRKTV